MKQLTCEMCGGKDLIKDSGFFICQNCGCKYTVEEAKKLMIEGLVDVSGSTVKLDDSAELQNLYELARRAKDTDNNDNGLKYYEMIILKDPASWEANFYSIYFKALKCKIGEISEAATTVKKCIDTTFELILKNVEDTEKNTVIREVFYKTEYLINVLDKNVPMSSISDLNVLLAIGSIRLQVIESLLKYFSSDDDVMGDVGVEILKKRVDGKAPAAETQRLMSYISKYDPNYIPPIEEDNTSINSNVNPSTSSTVKSNNNSQGCYIATAVYGSYDCPEVWTLRRFRDYYLSETWHGRAFIRTYYAISPILVKWFGHTKWFKRMWKGKLDRMIKTLQDKDYKSTPYEDREWK